MSAVDETIKQAYQAIRRGFRSEPSDDPTMVVPAQPLQTLLHFTTDSQGSSGLTEDDETLNSARKAAETIKSETKHTLGGASVPRNDLRTLLFFVGKQIQKAKEAGTPLLAKQNSFVLTETVSPPSTQRASQLATPSTVGGANLSRKQDPSTPTKKRPSRVASVAGNAEPSIRGTAPASPPSPSFADDRVENPTLSPVPTVSPAVPVSAVGVVTTPTMAADSVGNGAGTPAPDPLESCSELELVSAKLLAAVQRQAALKCECALAKHLAASAGTEAATIRSDTKALMRETELLIEELNRADQQVVADFRRHADEQRHLLDGCGADFAAWREVAQKSAVQRLNMQNVGSGSPSGLPQNVAELERDVLEVRRNLIEQSNDLHRKTASRGRFLEELQAARSHFEASETDSSSNVVSDFASHNLGGLLSDFQRVQDECAYLRCRNSLDKKETDTLSVSLQTFAPKIWHDKRIARDVPSLTRQLEDLQMGLRKTQGTDVVINADAVLSCVLQRVADVADNVAWLQLQLDDDVGMAISSKAEALKEDYADVDDLRNQISHEACRLRRISDCLVSERDVRQELQRRSRQRATFNSELAEVTRTLSASASNSSPVSRNTAGTSFQIHFTPGMLDDLVAAFQVEVPPAEDWLVQLAKECSDGLAVNDSTKPPLEQAMDTCAQIGWNASVECVARAASGEVRRAASGGVRSNARSGSPQRWRRRSDRVLLGGMKGVENANLHDLQKEHTELRRSLENACREAEIAAKDAANFDSKEPRSDHSRPEVGSGLVQLRSDHAELVKSSLDRQLEAATARGEVNPVQAVCADALGTFCCSRTLAAATQQSDSIGVACTSKRRAFELGRDVSDVISCRAAVARLVEVPNDVHERCAAMDLEIARLTEELEKSKQNKTDAMSRRDILSSRAAELTENIKKTKQEIQIAETVVEDLASNTTKIPQLLQTVRQERELLNARKEEHTRAMRTLAMYQNAEARKNSDQSDAELVTLRSKVKTASTKLAQEETNLKKSKESWDAEKKKGEETNENARKQVEQSKAELEKNLQSKQNNVDELAEELNKCEGDLEKNKQSWLENQATWMRRKAQLENLARAVQRRERERREAASTEIAYSNACQVPSGDAANAQSSNSSVAASALTPAAPQTRPGKREACQQLAGIPHAKAIRGGGDSLPGQPGLPSLSPSPVPSPADAQAEPPCEASPVDTLPNPSPITPHPSPV